MCVRMHLLVYFWGKTSRLGCWLQGHNYDVVCIRLSSFEYLFCFYAMFVSNRSALLSPILSSVNLVKSLSSLHRLTWPRVTPILTLAPLSSLSSPLVLIPWLPCWSLPMIRASVVTNLMPSHWDKDRWENFNRWESITFWDTERVSRPQGLIYII